MNCPKCGVKTKVWYTDRHQHAVFRTRICPACSAAFKTAEEAFDPIGVKKTEQVEASAQEKVPA